MIAYSNPSRSEHKRGCFQMQNADKVTSRIGLFSSVGRISNVGRISSVSLRVVTFWDKLNS